MSTKSTFTHKREDMPEQARQFYDLCEQFGFKPKFTFEYPTPENHEKRIQIRVDKHVAPAKEVNRYASMMKNGDKFPPLILTQDGWLVDGATRGGAAKKNKFPHVQALILDEDYAEAPESVKQRLTGLGAAFNLRNGKGIDRAEVRNAVEFIGKNPNYNSTSIAALLGCTESTVRAILLEKRARDRADKLGISLNGELPASIMRTIGASEASINDDPFRELLRLVADSGMPQKDLAVLIKNIKAAKSDAGAMKILQAEREARKQQIAERKATGGRMKPAFASQLRQHLGFVTRFMDKPENLVEHSPNLWNDHLRIVENAILILQQTAQKQTALRKQASAKDAGSYGLD
jgi:hypothetical protein